MDNSKTPKVFISYSWSSQEHQLIVKEWADRLSSDGIEVILDIYDLKEGQDIFAFMEKMVTDPNVTNVLVICDEAYAEKADKRRAGVGAETQIISKEVYEKVNQTKFIPIAIDFNDDGKAILPTFLKGRRWIDFSTLEAVNSNWEQLVRAIFGKPLYQKPPTGSVPAYIQQDSPFFTTPISVKYSTLKQAILLGKSGVKTYRRDFLTACFSAVDSLRTRTPLLPGKEGEQILEVFDKLLDIRNHLIDWILLESETKDSNELSDVLIDFLEKIQELKSRPQGVLSWNETSFEAHELFAYEIFLYVVACLLRTNQHDCLHFVFKAQYLLPNIEGQGSSAFAAFDTFWMHAKGLHAVIRTPDNRHYISPAAELIKRRAQREDIPFSELIQAELLIFLMALIIPKARWHPQTFLYASSRSDFPFFLKASQHRNFLKLAKITGFSDASLLRSATEHKYKDFLKISWHQQTHWFSLWEALNMDGLATLP